MTVISTGPDLTALPAALEWIAGLLTGSIATSVGMIAIAGVGFAMLAGRVSWRDGARVVLGCFVLFGAATLSARLIGLAGGSAEEPTVTVPVELTPAPAPIASQPVFDPYAGASVPN